MNLNEKELKDATAEIEKNMSKMDLDEYSEDDSKLYFHIIISIL